MLGKGLESLIPSQNNGQPRPGGQTNPIRSPFGVPPPSHQSPASPVPDVAPALPAHPEAPELPPVFAHEDLLPRGPEPSEAPMILHTAQDDEPTQAAVLPPQTPTSTPPAVRAPVESSYQPKITDSVFQIEVDRIVPNPHQPRKSFDDDAIHDLAASIREFGILQPIVVTKIEQEVPTGTRVEYQLIAGERRLRAAKSIGLERIPAIIRTVDVARERLELAIIENLQRENLNPIEMARAFSRLQDEFRLTQREIASRLGKSREVVANTVRLLDLPPYIQKSVEEGQISESHGRLLLSVADPMLQKQLFQDLLDKRMTTRELKERVAKPKAPQDRLHVLPEVKVYEERLSERLGTPVRISQDGTSGKITISFYSPEELQHLLRELAAGDML